MYEYSGNNELMEKGLKGVEPRQAEEFDDLVFG